MQIVERRIDDFFVEEFLYRSDIKMLSVNLKHMRVHCVIYPLHVLETSERVDLSMSAFMRTQGMRRDGIARLAKRREHMGVAQTSRWIFNNTPLSLN